MGIMDEIEEKIINISWSIRSLKTEIEDLKKKFVKKDELDNRIQKKIDESLSRNNSMIGSYHVG